ncbi:prepilin-type N-terminal cleavage/methylation domain-containing protein [Acetobacterium paludosum]|uniref:Prepilin-type N-terminal cleavage/methylation domain-containing protein n=1 Tax=Acetobacterium paludosum TaxID=52693 RepID=A0A923HU24_9FIRM|nr:prepilin-type N-terminal cleavage/methylation domain-containing protein [Acetobacterium paludosum]MBC3887202.1 prepilin-type N-terminal cleavage/methylation domain-containing protein [Acetobacterium paludosum]
MVIIRLDHNKGFSLIEVITALMVISLVLVMLLSGLIFVNSIDQKAETNQKVSYNERYLNLYFQKQVLESERIIVKSDRIYLQDLENPDLYYNYYQFRNGFLRRYKVYKGSLNSIGSGGNSQFTDNVQAFSLSLGPNNEIVLEYTLSVDGENFYRKTTIRHGKTVEII